MIIDKRATATLFIIYRGVRFIWVSLYLIHRERGIRGVVIHLSLYRGV